jgi:hypothetical protein
MFQYLREIEGYYPKRGSGPDHYYPPTALKDPLRPRLYTFRKEDTAVHFSCPVNFLDDAPQSSPGLPQPDQKVTSGSQHKGGPRHPTREHGGHLYVWEPERTEESDDLAKVLQACSKLDVIVTTEEYLEHVSRTWEVLASCR